jgi:hypothetical protein
LHRRALFHTHKDGRDPSVRVVFLQWMQNQSIEVVGTRKPWTNRSLLPQSKISLANSMSVSAKRI